MITKSIRLEPNTANAERLLTRNDQREIALFGGNYLGAKEEDGQKYYRYVLPNVYDSDRSYLELMVPIDFISTTKKPMMREVASGATLTNFPAYVAYGEVSNNIHINSQFIIAKLGVSLDTGYPPLLLVGLHEYGQKIAFRLGKKITSNEEKMRLSEKNRQSAIYKACLDEKYAFWRPGMRTVTNDDVLNRKCDEWLWSNVMLTEESYRPSVKYIMKTFEYLGYLITVPIDIITSPFQLWIWYRYTHGDWH